MIANQAVQINTPVSNSVTFGQSTHIIGSRKVPQILALAASRVEQWSDKSWKYLTRFRISILERILNGRRISARTMRKEQRQAITALLRVILANLNLSTMQIGFIDKQTGIFVHLTLEYLAHQAKLDLRTAQRAMSWLYESGYVIGTRQSSVDLDTGEYINKPSIRQISGLLLSDLGISHFALSNAKQRSAKPTVKKSVGNIAIKAFNQLKENFTSKLKPICKPTNPIKTFCLIEYKEKLAKLMEAMPHISLSEAQSMLPRPPS